MLSSAPVHLPRDPNIVNDEESGFGPLQTNMNSEFKNKVCNSNRFQMLHVLTFFGSGQKYEILQQQRDNTQGSNFDHIFDITTIMDLGRCQTCNEYSPSYRLVTSRATTL
ncbi:hypothetical protein J6590_100453 [Homalodisca vitripennis]|nr:hypothetical protein J6590_100453 [Homalodisca vitripennis]